MADNNWVKKKIKYIFDVINGGTPKSNVEEYWSENEMVWITPEDLSTPGREISDSRRKISKAGVTNSSATLIKANSIVLSTRAPIGNVKISKVPYTTNQGCKSLQPNNKLHDIRFYYYFLSINKDFLNQLGRGTTFLELSNHALKNIEILTPDFDTQNLIANYVDTKTAQIDSLIADKERLIELLEEKRQAIITETVTKGLDPNVKMKDSEVEWIEKVPVHYSKIKLKFVSNKIIDGTHHTPKYTENGIPFLRVTDITRSKGKSVDLENIKYISQEEHEELSLRCKPEKGDVLLTKNGTIGIPRVVNWDYEFSVFVSLCVIKLNHSKLNPYFLSYFFESSAADMQISYGEKKSTIYNLHLDKIKEFVLFLPPLEEQMEIVYYLNQIDSKYNSILEELDESVKLLKEYRESLIYEAVTGKIDLRDYEKDVEDLNFEDYGKVAEVNESYQ